MKSISKLKDDARKHEQKEEWEKAIQVYLQVLRIGEEGEGEVELPLYNRVGDLCLRLNRPGDAVGYYEQAADRYAEAGLYNNAIALCNKALRYDPDQIELLKKLGQFSASQGFITDARRYFLDYAERQFNAGRTDEALTALEDFANVSDDADVREILGRRLHAHGRSEEAVEELRRAYAAHVQAGDSDRAQAVRSEITAIDPNATFAPAESAPEPARYAAPPLESTPASDDLTGLLDIDPGAAHADSVQAAPEGGLLDGFETGRAEDDVDLSDFGSLEISGFDDSGGADEPPAAGLEGLETTSLDFGAASADLTPLDNLDIEHDETSFDLPLLPEEDEDVADEGAAFELPTLDDDEGSSFDLPTLEGTSSFDLPTLEEEDAEAESFTFGTEDEGSAVDAEASFELPQLAGEDDASFALPELSHDDDTSLELPTPEEEEDDTPFALPELSGDEDSSFELPSLEEHERGTDEAGALPGFESAAFGIEDAGFGDEAWLQSATSADTADTDAVFDDMPAVTADEALSAAGAVDETAGDELADADQATAEHEVADDAAVAQEAAGEDWTPEMSMPPAPEKAAAPAAPRAQATPQEPEGGFIDLGALLAEDEVETTRFRVQETAPTGDEDRDFAELLNQFKAKVSEHLPAEDAAAHYDLGLAFKEMGLIDEAIAEFQIALRAGQLRLKVYEELGQCFLQKEQYNIAEKVLRRALEMKYEDEIELLGVYYHLGRAYEGMDRPEQARDAYERVLGMDINFQDVTARLERL